MCLLILAWQVHSRYRLILAANRDEFHDRPAVPLALWPKEGILAGRDLRAGGTWLGLDRERRFGAVTNFRELQKPLRSAPSRGGLVPAYLAQQGSAQTFLAGLEDDAAHYSGFNLLLADTQELWYASNRAPDFARALPPGVYGLSNEQLDTPWPKLERVRTRFQEWLARSAEAPAEELIAILADRTPSPAQGGPTFAGLDPVWERALSAPFVVHPSYGTRCSTALVLEKTGALRVLEHRFDAAGRLAGETAVGLNPTEWV